MLSDRHVRCTAGVRAASVAESFGAATAEVAWSKPSPRCRTSVVASAGRKPSYTIVSRSDIQVRMPAVQRKVAFPMQGIRTVVHNGGVVAGE